MSKLMFHRRIVISLMGITLAGIFTCAYAQWPNDPDPRIPRTKDGKPNLTAPAPRLNGKPAISGVWQAERSPASEYDRVLGHEARRGAASPGTRCDCEPPPAKPSGESLHTMPSRRHTHAIIGSNV